MIVPTVFCPLPRTMLLPRDWKIPDEFSKPTPLFVTVEFDTRTVPLWDRAD